MAAADSIDAGRLGIVLGRPRTPSWMDALMAKIRSLKGEFFRNAGISRGGLVAKTLAAGLICAVADDDGRFKVKVDDFKGEIFTHDPVSVAEIDQALQSLVSEDFVRVYHDHGRAFGAVVNWKSHQPVPPSRYIASVLPAPPNTKQRRHSPTERKHSKDIASSRAGVGSEGIGREGIGSDRKGEDSAGTEASELLLIPPVSLSPTEQVFEAWRVMWHPTAKLTKERRTKVEARLRDGWSVEDLVVAVTEGVAADPWAERHVAMNDDLTHLLKNGGAVEKFLELARTPLVQRMPASKSRASQLDRVYADAAQAAREEGR